MPVEIKELIIRAVAVDDKETGDASRKAAPSRPLDQGAIVEAAVREVLRILKNSRER